MAASPCASRLYSCTRASIPESTDNDRHQQSHLEGCSKQSDIALTDFVLGHGRHDTFGFFQYPNEDVGFVCYCQEHNGRSIALRIPEELDMGEEACEFIWQYQKEI